MRTEIELTHWSGKLFHLLQPVTSAFHHRHTLTKIARYDDILESGCLRKRATPFLRLPDDAPFHHNEGERQQQQQQQQLLAACAPLVLGSTGKKV